LEDLSQFEDCLEGHEHVTLPTHDPDTEVD
jgi:hypothetical protein